MPRIQIANAALDLLQDPSVCPRCHKSVAPEYITARFISVDYGEPKVAEVVYRCPAENCERLFLAIYEQVPVAGKDSSVYKHAASLPRIPRVTIPEREVSQVSPEF